MCVCVCVCVLTCKATVRVLDECIKVYVCLYGSASQRGTTSEMQVSDDKGKGQAGHTHVTTNTKAAHTNKDKKWTGGDEFTARTT